MIKKTFTLALVLCLCLTLLSPGLVQAQSTLTIVDSSAQVEFPSKLIFSLSAESDVNIVDIRLGYSVDRLSFAEVTSEAYIEFVPDTTVDVSWTLEMVRIGGLPPGSSVEYWWVVEDTSGDKVETTPVQVQFSDNRYQWRSLTEGKVTIYWYEGDESFARELMATAQQTLDRLAADTGAYLEKPARLYTYATTQDLAGALIHAREWTGGVAFTRFGIISIGISPANLSWGKGAIAHELAHLVVNQMTLNPYSDLPTWLNEGLAMYAEGILEPEYASHLHKAVTEDSLISVRSLASPFSAHAEAASLSYAESYSLVEFLIHEYGQAKMLELLNTFRQGSSYDGALEKVYGFNMDGLDTLWRDYATQQYQSGVVEEKGTNPALIGVIVALAIGLLLGSGLAIGYTVRRRGR
jgi:hypothetical protein